MTTSSMTATSEWQQVTDGTVDRVIQAIGGEIRLCDSATMPGGKAPSHRITGWASITAPTIAWIRAGNTTPVMVIIT